jgi:hypothetical protein
MNNNIDIDSTISGSINDNIDIDSTISGSMNNNIDIDSTFIYVLPLEIHLLIGEDCDPINWFNSATILCLSQVRT